MIKNELQLPTEKIIDNLLTCSLKKRELFWRNFTSPILQKRLAQNLYYSKVVTIIDKKYPPQLLETFAPPVALFYQGKLSLSNYATSLAIVGARENSPYAVTVLKRLLPEVISSGIVTLSGLAQGVDSLVHKLTMDYQGRTVAVIGTGLDVVYPQNNAILQDKISTSGLLLTEYGLGQPPRRYHFPERNRIIAGLCRSTLVVEARQHSGSLITANLALQENRNVLAVPGAINAPLSAGTNALLAAGAKPVLNASHIIEEFDYT
ncbi:DNA processing protein [Liquorilactobacillus capillatus DSM 19910]|uniref:DNA processing protein n=2 Tax=Liquorilactobacillus capillatus TaxID=480931 RepID=A0A0R1MAZ5_9LACO|nr:DNA processing protein [Liquorilactobacillus capillatus DSM 19910]